MAWETILTRADMGQYLLRQVIRTKVCAACMTEVPYRMMSHPEWRT